VPKIQLASTSPAEVEADLLIVPAFEGPVAGPGLKELIRSLDPDPVDVLRQNRFRGKLGETFLLPAGGQIGSDSVLVVGLGEAADVDADRIRRMAGKIAGRASKFGRVATSLPQAFKGWPDAVQAFVEGVLLGAYRFDRYKTPKNGEGPRWRTVVVLGTGRTDARAGREAIRRGQTLAESVAWARDLVNTPAADAPPAFLAQEAKRMAREVGLQCKVLTKTELQRGGFGGILGVGQGSDNEPRLIELRYSGGGTGAPIALSGKGITFDSGGLSIKDAKGMEWMKSDMAGAATMMAAMRAIAILKPKVNVIAAIPSAENMSGGSATRPGDILRHRGGRTSEVLNTDAEGRLVLADALAYLTEKKPRLIVDAATLTGACMIALGDELWGVMGSDRDVVRQLLDAGEEAGEPGWELPLWAPYRKKIDSDVADVKNIGDRYGGAITAALFLKDFVGDVPWAHMDIAGTAFSERPGDYWAKGATGNPVRTIVRFVEQQAATKAPRAGRAKSTAAR
jgi:leucyl aminopeptidase